MHTVAGTQDVASKCSMLLDVPPTSSPHVTIVAGWLKHACVECVWVSTRAYELLIWTLTLLCAVCMAVLASQEHFVVCSRDCAAYHKPATIYTATARPCELQDCMAQP